MTSLIHRTEKTFTDAEIPTKSNSRISVGSDRQYATKLFRLTVDTYYKLHTTASQFSVDFQLFFRRFWLGWSISAIRWWDMNWIRKWFCENSISPRNCKSTMKHKEISTAKCLRRTLKKGAKHLSLWNFANTFATASNVTEAMTMRFSCEEMMELILSNVFATI